MSPWDRLSWLALRRGGVSMGFRRRTRRRALVAGAAVAHHRANVEQQQAYEEAPVEEPAASAPPPTDTADEIEHLAQLHASGALTDDEFAAAKAQTLGG